MVLARLGVELSPPPYPEFKVAVVVSSAKSSNGGMLGAIFHLLRSFDDEGSYSLRHEALAAAGCSNVEEKNSCPGPGILLEPLLAPRC